MEVVFEIDPSFFIGWLAIPVGDIGLEASCLVENDVCFGNRLARG